MNLNNKQLSLIITFCLTGIIVLTAYNLKLRDKQEEESLYELTFDEELLNEEIPLEEPQKMTELETHQAYNEANESRYAQELEDFKTLEELQEEIAEMEAEQEEGDELNELSENLSMAKEFADRLKRQKEAMEKLREKENIQKQPVNIKRKTTISYSLKDRYEVIKIPNPVYTCESFGKVVINIEVDEHGKVIEAGFNSKSSTTSNRCLIDNAIYYAKQARFNAVPGKPVQLGTISYSFQGD